MRLSILTDTERWEWFAAGDPTVAPKLRTSSSGENSAQRVAFEVGLTIAIPLLIAALIGIVWSA